jgi:hypothetical protein
MPRQKREPHKTVYQSSFDIAFNKAYILVGLPADLNVGKQEYFDNCIADVCACKRIDYLMVLKGRASQI